MLARANDSKKIPIRFQLLFDRTRRFQDCPKNYGNNRARWFSRCHAALMEFSEITGVRESEREKFCCDAEEESYIINVDTLTCTASEFHIMTVFNFINRFAQ
jgi:hypothetical protein